MTRPNASKKFCAVHGCTLPAWRNTELCVNHTGLKGVAKGGLRERTVTERLDALEADAALLAGRIAKLERDE
jgi:hypothetical protein